MSDVVIDSIRALELPGVLEEVSAHARSTPGKFLVLNSFPLTDSSIIEKKLKMALEMKEALNLYGDFSFSGLVPLEGVFEKLSGPSSVLDPEEILAVRDLLTVGSYS